MYVTESEGVIMNVRDDKMTSFVLVGLDQLNIRNGNTTRETSASKNSAEMPNDKKDIAFYMFCI